MLITQEEAVIAKLDVTEDDIKAMEMSIISHTNNHFHMPGYSPDVVRIVNKRLYVDEINLFAVNDTTEVHGIQYYDGFHHVTAVGVDWIEIDIDLNIEFEFVGTLGKLYLIKFPADVKAGAKKAWQYQVKADKKIGIKSESISRMSVTYDKAESGNTINGLPAYLFDFLEPYHKMRWS